MISSIALTFRLILIESRPFLVNSILKSLDLGLSLTLFISPFTADASGFLSLRINDSDPTLGDNDGAITVNLRGPANNALEVTESLRQNPPYYEVV